MGEMVARRARRIHHANCAAGGRRDCKLRARSTRFATRVRMARTASRALRDS